MALYPCRKRKKTVANKTVNYVIRFTMTVTVDGATPRTKSGDINVRVVYNNGTATFSILDRVTGISAGSYNRVMYYTGNTPSTVSNVSMTQNGSNFKLTNTYGYNMTNSYDSYNTSTNTAVYYNPNDDSLTFDNYYIVQSHTRNSLKYRGEFRFAVISTTVT